MTPRATNKRSPCDLSTASRYMEQAREFLDGARGATGTIRADYVPKSRPRTSGIERAMSTSRS